MFNKNLNYRWQTILIPFKELAITKEKLWSQSAEQSETDIGQ